MLNQRILSYILFQTDAELSAESERTYAGFIWWILEPIISMAVYYLVFGMMFQRGTEDFIPFLFVGLIVWRWLSSSVLRGAGSILDNRSLMQQVYLPKIVFPTVSVLANAAKFVVIFFILITFLMFAGYRVSVTYIALPVVFCTALLWVTALTYFFAAIVPFLPDLRILLENSLRLIFFLSGVFFSIDSLSRTQQILIRLNPFASLIESFRDVMLYHRWPLWQPLLVTCLASITLGLFGGILIARKDCVYPKIGY